MTLSNEFSEEDWQNFLDEVINSHTGSSKLKQDRSKRREQELLRAAIRVFAREGIARARIGDIAAEAGMPVSTLYEYYSGKEDIAHAVPQAQMHKFFLEYKEGIANRVTAYDRLWYYLFLAADYARRNPEWARALYLEVWPSVMMFDSPARGSMDDYIKIVIYLLKMGEANGDWPAGPNPYETAAILVGSINHIIITWLLYRQPRNLTTAAAAMADRTMQLLHPMEKVAG